MLENMPDMPAAFYVPAFGALVGALGAVVGIGTKIVLELWKRNVYVTERTFTMGDKQAEALNSVDVAIKENTIGLGGIRLLLEGITHALLTTPPDAERRRR